MTCRGFLRSSKRALTSMHLAAAATVRLLAASLLRPRARAPFACSASLRPAIESWLDGALANEQRKRASLQKEADAAASAERMGQWATLVVANLYRIDDRAESAVVEDWENGGEPVTLTFDKALGRGRGDVSNKATRREKLSRVSPTGRPAAFPRA